MTKTNFPSHPIKIFILMLMTFAVVFSGLAFTPSTAFAVGIGIGDGADTDGDIPPDVVSTPPGVIPSPGPVTIPMPGSGNGDKKSWKTVWGSGVDVRCGTSAYGDSLGIKVQMAEQWMTAETAPYSGFPWNRAGIAFDAPEPEPDSYWWTRTIPTGSYECIWPPAFQYVSAECIISTSANIQEVRPGNIVLDSRTVYSGYTLGSTDRNACTQSKSSIALNANITRYSIVEARAVSQAARVTFKVYTQAHPQTGVVPATEVVGIIGPYNLTPKTASLSVSCRSVSNPADYSLTDFTDNMCNPSTWNPSYQCNANPVLFDTSGAGSTSPTMNSFPGNSVQFVKQQTANNGKQITFSQNPGGAGITVNSYKTRFDRSADSTPWDSSLSASKNLVELDAVNPGGSVSENILKNGTSSGWLSSKINDTKFIAYGASDNGSPTKISQILEWTGTRVVNSATITGINPLTGAINTAATTTTVPTSGMCTQTATIDMVRTIGDTVK